MSPTHAKGLLSSYVLVAPHFLLSPFFYNSRPLMGLRLRSADSGVQLLLGNVSDACPGGLLCGTYVPVDPHLSGLFL